jgi:hypothetical protein
LTRVDRLFCRAAPAALILLAALAAGFPAGRAHASPRHGQLQAEPAPATSLVGGVAIPFEFDPPRKQFIVVKARLNGRGRPLAFIVDTGASFPIIFDNEAARRLKLPLEGRTGTVNEHVQAAGVKVSRFSLQAEHGWYDRIGDTDNGLSAIMTDLSVLRTVGTTRSDIVGIVGWPFFLHTTFQIDFDQKRLTIWDAPTPQAAFPGSITSRIAIARDGFHAGIRLESGDAAAPLIDTGSYDSAVPLALGQKLNPLATRMVEDAGIGSFGLSPRWLLRTIIVGGFRERDVAVTAAQTEHLVRLGMDIVARYNMLFDPRRHTITLVRRSDPTAIIRPLGCSGVQLAEVPGGRLLIASVAPGSPASLARLRRGDEILSVDDVNLKGLTVITAGAVVDGSEGVQEMLRVRFADGETLVVPLTPTSEFNRPPTVWVGLAFRKVENEQMVVLDVRPNSLADRAGIRAGDHIVKIEGRETQNLAFNDFHLADLFGRVTLEVQHPDSDQTRTVVLALRGP